MNLSTQTLAIVGQRNHFFGNNHTNLKLGLGRGIDFEAVDLQHGAAFHGCTVALMLRDFLGAGQTHGVGLKEVLLSLARAVFIPSCWYMVMSRSTSRGWAAVAVS